MLLQLISNGIATGEWKYVIIASLLSVVASLVALSMHEAAHGLAAYFMGDRTAYNMGRVTLNPSKHLDPMGTLMMLVFGFGWAKPVPINARNFRNPKWGMALTAIAGPFSNIVLGLLGAISTGIIDFIANFAIPNYIPRLMEFTYYVELFSVLLILAKFFSIINFVYAFFNLIPLPPFDGSRFFFTFLPPKWYFGIMKYERYIMIGTLVLIMACSRLFNFSPFYTLANNAWEILYHTIRLLLYNLVM